MKKWRRGEASGEDVRLAADVAYRATQASPYPPSSAVREAGVAATHAAYATYFFDRDRPVDRKHKIFEATRAACSHAERVNNDKGKLIFPKNGIKYGGQRARKRWKKWLITAVTQFIKIRGRDWASLHFLERFTPM